MELPFSATKTSELVGGASSKEAFNKVQTDLLDSQSDTPITTNKLSGKKSIIADLLAQSSRHLFGPTSSPTLPLKHQVVSIEGLLSKLTYLKPEEVVQIKKHFNFQMLRI